VIDESVGLASIVKSIAENENFSFKNSKEDYLKNRNKAIVSGFNIKDELIDNEELASLKEYNNYSRKKLSSNNGADWQIEVYKKNGLGSVISSIADSFKKDKRAVKNNQNDLAHCVCAARIFSEGKLYGLSDRGQYPVRAICALSVPDYQDLAVPLFLQPQGGRLRQRPRSHFAWPITLKGDKGYSHSPTSYGASQPPREMLFPTIYQPNSDRVRPVSSQERTPYRGPRNPIGP